MRNAVIGSLAFFASLSARAAPDAPQHALVLGPGFTPHPLIIADIRAEPPASVNLPMRSHGDCSATQPSEPPILTFELTAEIADMLVSIEDSLDRSCSFAIPHSSIAFPDGKRYCKFGDGTFYEKKWPRGTYKLYLTSSPERGTPKERFKVRFEQPARTRLEARQAIAAVPTYDIEASAPTNPLFISMTGKTSIKAQHAGLAGCLPPAQKVQPLIRLNLKRDMSDLFVRIQDSPFILQPANADPGPCVPEKDEGAATGQARDVKRRLAVGVYTVYAILEKPAAQVTYVIEIDDRTRPLAFAEVTPTPVGGLAKPLVLKGQMRTPGPWPERDRQCGLGAPLDPDFYLVSREPLRRVTLRLRESETPQALRVWGPLETRRPDDPTVCPRDSFGSRRSVLDLDAFEGTYAVWVGNPDRERSDTGVGKDFDLIITSSTTQVDPLAYLFAPPAELTIAERSLSRHYPFLGNANPLAASFRLFTEAPDGLFVYPRVDIDPPAGDPTAKAPIKDEPLLVHDTYSNGTEVETHEGARFLVPTQLLTTVRPAKAHFLPAPRPVTASPSAGGMVTAKGKGASMQKTEHREMRRDEQFRAVKRRFGL